MKVLPSLIFLVLLLQFGCDTTKGILPSKLEYTPDSIELKIGDYGESGLPTIAGTAPYTYSIANNDLVGHFVSINSVNGQLSIQGDLAELGDYSININVQNESGISFFEGAYSIKIEALTPEEQLQIDLDLIDQWISDNGITDTLHHPSKIRYTINKTGTGTQAQVGLLLRTSYEGRYLNGEVFDSNESFEFLLNSGSLISGWYYMLQEMREGDEFTIYLPSLYAYGVTGGGLIAPNTIMVFDIKLISVGE